MLRLGRHRLTHCYRSNTMRRRQLKGLWERLKKLKAMKLKRDERLKKLGAALHDYPVAARLVECQVQRRSGKLTFRLRKDKLCRARQREGRYLLRSNITSGRSPEELWTFYIQLTEVEAAFKTLKDDLVLRPIRHQLEHRIEAHIFICFLAYCLQVTLRRRLHRQQQPHLRNNRQHALRAAKRLGSRVTLRPGDRPLP